MSILKEITSNTKANLPDKSKIQKLEANKTTLSLVDSINSSKYRPALIAEFKRRSPSKGNINLDISLKQVVETYNDYASAMSILTDEKYFGGKIEDLKEARRYTDLPLLRKDFIIDERQIKEARHYGADAYLLIVAALERQQLDELIDAGNEYTMTALIEVHNESELEIALQSKAELIGINNRNLHDMTISIQTTIDLMSMTSDHDKERITFITESGIFSNKEVEILPKEIRAMLVGTSLMSSLDIESQIHSLLGQK